MSERTVIATVEVTKIFKDMPDCSKLNEEIVKADISAKVKEALDSDSVVVTNVQEFIRDVEE